MDIIHQTNSCPIKNGHQKWSGGVEFCDCDFRGTGHTVTATMTMVAPVMVREASGCSESTRHCKGTATSVGGPVRFVLCHPCTSDVMSAVLNMWLVYCLWVAAIFVEVCKFGNGTMTKGVESVM